MGCLGSSKIHVGTDTATAIELAAPAAPNETAAPAAPNETAAPAAPNETAAPAAPNETAAAAAPNETAAPAAPNETAAPAAPNETAAPAAPNETAAPAAPNETAAPAAPNQTAAPAAPNETAAPAATDAPAAPVAGPAPHVIDNQAEAANPERVVAAAPKETAEDKAKKLASLIAAVRNANVEEVRMLITQIADISARDGDGNTAMLVAYTYLKPEIAATKQIAMTLVDRWYELVTTPVTTSENQPDATSENQPDATAVTRRDHEYLKLAIKECNWVVLFILPKLGRITFGELEGLVSQQEAHLKCNPLLDAYLKDKLHDLRVRMQQDDYKASLPLMEQDEFKDCLKSEQPLPHAEDKLQCFRVLMDQDDHNSKSKDEYPHDVNTPLLDEQLTDKARLPCLQLLMEQDGFKTGLQSDLSPPDPKDKLQCLQDLMKQDDFKACLNSKPLLDKQIKEKGSEDGLALLQQQDGFKVFLEAKSLLYSEIIAQGPEQGVQLLREDENYKKGNYKEVLGKLLDYAKTELQCLRLVIEQDGFKTCLKSEPLHDAKGKVKDLRLLMQQDDFKAYVKSVRLSLETQSQFKTFLQSKPLLVAHLTAKLGDFTTKVASVFDKSCRLLDSSISLSPLSTNEKNLDLEDGQIQALKKFSPADRNNRNFYVPPAVITYGAKLGDLSIIKYGKDFLCGAALKKSHQLYEFEMNPLLCALESHLCTQESDLCVLENNLCVLEKNKLACAKWIIENIEPRHNLVLRSLEDMTKAQTDDQAVVLYHGLTPHVFMSLLSKNSQEKKIMEVIGKQEQAPRSDKEQNKLAVFMSAAASVYSVRSRNDTVGTSPDTDSGLDADQPVTHATRSTASEDNLTDTLTQDIILVVTKKFVDSGANINGEYERRTALSYALKHDLHDVVRYLQEKNAKVTLESDVASQNKYLLSAIEYKFPRYVYDTYELVKDEPKKYHFHEAFSAALKTNQLDVAIEFMRKGIPVRPVGLTSYSYILHKCVVDNNAKLVEELLTSIKRNNYVIDIDMFVDDRSCLYHAIKNKNLEIVKQQCEGGRYKKLETGEYEPCEDGEYKLLKGGVYKKTSACSRWWTSRWGEPCNACTCKKCCWCFDKNSYASINRIDKNDMTALELAQNLHHYEIEKYLLNLRTCCLAKRGWDRKDKKFCSFWCGRTYLTDQSTTAWLLIIGGLIVFHLTEMKKEPVECSPYFWIIIGLQIALILGYLLCFCLAGCICCKDDLPNDDVHEIDKKYDLNKQNLLWGTHLCIKEDISCEILFHDVDNLKVETDGSLLLDDKKICLKCCIKGQSKKFWCSLYVSVKERIESHHRALLVSDQLTKRVQMLNNLIKSQTEWKKVPEMHNKHYSDLPYYLLVIMILRKDTDGFNKILDSEHIFKPGDKFNKQVFPNKRTLLYYAIYYENVDAVEALCSRGAEMDVLDENKITARELARNVHQKNKKGDDIDKDLETYGGVLERDVYRFNFKWQFAIASVIFLGTVIYYIVKLARASNTDISSPSPAQNSTSSAPNSTSSFEVPSNAIAYLPVLANQISRPQQDISGAYHHSVHTQSLAIEETQPDMDRVVAQLQLLKSNSHTFFNGFVYLKVEGLSNTHIKITDYPMEVVALAKKLLEAEKRAEFS